MSRETVLVQSIVEIRKKLDELQIAKDKAESELLEIQSKNIYDQLGKTEYGTGTISLDTGPFQVRVTYPKRTKYNQKMMENIYDTIAENGDDPAEYIDVKYNVAESKYKAWPEHIRKVFQPARTVEVGKPQIKIEKKGRE